MFRSLQLFTSEEELVGGDQWYCSRCKKFRDATKKFDLWKLPDILIIHLKRFKYNRCATQPRAGEVARMAVRQC